MHLGAVDFAVIVSMIKSQEWHSRFTATHAFSPIVHDYANPSSRILGIYSLLPSRFVDGILDPFCMPFLAFDAFTFSRLPRPATAAQSIFIACAFSLPPLFGAAFALTLVWSGYFAETTTAHTFSFSLVAPLLHIFLAGVGH